MAMHGYAYTRPPDLSLASVVSIDDLEASAPLYLSAAARDYYASGAETGSTLRDNVAAYGRYRLVPRMLVPGSSRPSLHIRLLNWDLPSPVIVAPTAMHGLAHTEREMATVTACAKRGTAFCLSTVSNTCLEDVAAGAGAAPLLLQLYMTKDRAFTVDLLRRAERTGYSAVVLTIDLPVPGRRWADMRRGFYLPADLALPNLPPSTSIRQGVYENTATKDNEASGLHRFFSEVIEQELTWDDVTWLRSVTSMQVLVKGILHPADADRAVSAGAHCIIVSNHGGRQADGAIASLDALEAVVKAVGSRVPVLLDGGVRRGTDVLKALAIGARAVMIGRPVLWGLACAGHAGVGKVLDILAAELTSAMQLNGIARASNVPRGSVLGPGEKLAWPERMTKSRL